jgi:DNA (cytosine-5)-methyltransferase 1
VPGLLSIEGGVVFEQVCLDLESEGYEVQSFVLPACATGAPHRRDRVWIVAYSNEVRRGSGFRSIPEANGEISEWHENAELSNAGTGVSSYPKHNGHCSKQGKVSKKNRLQGINRQEICSWESHRAGINNDAGITPNNYKKRLEGRSKTGNTKRIREKSHQQPKRLSNNYWSNWPSISPFHTGFDGISDDLVRHIRTSLSEAGQTPEQIEAYLRKEANWLRKEAIKCAGNAIVPQVVLQIMKAIDEHNRTLTSISPIS